MSHQGTLPLLVARDMFLLDCEARRLAPATIDFYTRKLRKFFNWLDELGVHNVDEVSAHHLRAFLVAIEQNGHSSSYEHGLARAVKTFFNFCVRDELLEKSPFAKVRMPKLERKIPETISPVDLRSILNACTSERDRAICLFLLDTGVRARELLAMNIADVDVRTGAVVIQLGKGQKGRAAFIGKGTRKQIKLYLEERKGSEEKKALFVTEDGTRRLSQWAVVQLMERLRKRSGVTTCRCHSFRRTFAVTCLRNGMNIYVLAKLMGHADITTLRHYLHLVEDDLRAAHIRHGTVDHLGFSLCDLPKILPKTVSLQPDKVRPKVDFMDPERQARDKNLPSGYLATRTMTNRKRDR